MPGRGRRSRAAARPEGGAGPQCAVHFRCPPRQVRAALQENRIRRPDLLAQWEVAHARDRLPGLTAGAIRRWDWDEMLNVGD